ncbi:helicase [Ureibacillus massiliensis 4400831 = CIP 108448 = CCUG 49529]|uniref:Helicase n=2 Tax=cellular organisms TaxID=131567 RepID=A0A0A3J645_9BACL|nr:DEAD/DEAH box helicase [Ureibacillus massiliensis]KGR92509.1 helicase [Ureibacillus massiliensis 4400831 = CIP 108448 = CCUG 49529]
MIDDVRNATPFAKTLRLKIDQQESGFYTVKAFSDENLVRPVSTWSHQLFYRYEPNFFGLYANVENDVLYLSSAEFMDLLSPKYIHPFVQLQGANEESEKLIGVVKALQLLWNSSALWDYAVFQEDELVFELPSMFGEDAHVKSSLGSIDVDLAELSEILSVATKQKLAFSGLMIEDIPSLLPFFKEGGWPLNNERSVGDVRVALRLSEPEEDSEMWLLETVISNVKTAKVWTPAVRKRHLPIADTLPEKWMPYADEIVSLQKQILDLIQIEGANISSDFANQFLYIELEDPDVRKLLRNDFAKLQALGFEVILPAWLKELKQTRLRVRVSANNMTTRKVAGLDDILTFKWNLSVGGSQISEEQFRQMVNEKREFVRIGNEWFRLDAEWMNGIRELMDKAEQENWTVRELLFRELPEELTAPAEEESADEDDALRDDPLFAFEMQRSLKTYVDQLSEKKGLPAVAVPSTLQAELRPYQQEGFEWLVFMREQKFGAVLADDMGLGKTVQLISYVLHTVNELEVHDPAIIVCPTSVLGNWQKELERFAPSLRVSTHYSSSRAKDDEFVGYIHEAQPNVVLTTYGTVSQDVEFLERVNWSTIVLDEAQNIKNMQTLQSRAIRRLMGDHHIALTGTPIENRLSELWAIFDFIHKGYLGSFGKFQEQYILPIERDESDRHKEILRMKIRPFLLRRTKNDPDLQLNLPDKLEAKKYCPLTSEQAALYEGYIQDTLVGMESMSGFEKKGRILQMLSKLKQLCNHPALYLKEPFEDATVMMERSVKLKSIVELASEIVENGEQCLIFTQYIGMGHLLQHCFSELLDVDVPFLTGSMPKSQRDRLVDAFQAGEFPIFLLSLKAGGTGLNLTAASHVLHADRWWNPAVENQATDRAYRIGQTQFVQVHKFITIGTIEEKIDKMIELKSALSEELIQSSNWLTELQDEELLDLLTLDADVVRS